MPDTSLLPAIRAALKFNELGDGSPYELQFARLGQSGASFGVFQADLHVNPAARECLRQALAPLYWSPADGLERVIAAASVAMPSGNSLSVDDTNIVNAALSSPAGMALVEALDDATLQVVLGEVDQCVAAASPNMIAGDALCAIACWVNETGRPTTLLTWLEDQVGAPGTSLAQITLDAVMGYLAAETFYKIHPRNLLHLKDAVAAGVALLPVG